jgi:uncharacterized protein
MEQLFEIQKIILEQFDTSDIYHRSFYDQITWDNYATGIVGPRGIGKTTLLLLQALKCGAKSREALYVSADNLFFLENRLLDLADWLYKETSVKYLLIDEIHKYSNWIQELKNIIDTYKNLRILFSGSSTIDIIHSKYDLSRRVTLHSLHGLSFREYLEFYFKIKLPVYPFSDLIENHLVIAQNISVPQILKHFREYLRTGYYPFFKSLTQDREKFQAVENATQKTIYEDIATLHQIHSTNLIFIEKIFKYVINSSPGELNTHKLSRYLGKDYETIDNYIKYLNEAGLIRCLFSEKAGKPFLHKPVKIYPENTNLIYANYLLPKNADDTLGKIRETFAVNSLQNADQKIFYNEHGDFKIDQYHCEVGGKNKQFHQIKNQPNGYVIADDLVTGSNKNTIPLYLLGFLT